MSGQPHEDTDNHDTHDRNQDRDTDRDTDPRPATPRRLLLTTAALAPVLAGIGTAPARAQSPGPAPDPTKGGGHQHEPIQPMTTTAADWKRVAQALGRPGSMAGDKAYHTRFPRGDLNVVSYGVPVSTGLALGSHVAFVRYADGNVLVMGDLTVTEGELQEVTDVLQAHGIEQTALHKHLLAHSPRSGGPMSTRTAGTRWPSPAVCARRSTARRRHPPSRRHGRGPSIWTPTASTPRWA